MPSYERRRPEQTVLHRAVCKGLGPFVAAAAERRHEVPAFVDKEIRGYLDCGDLELGFARVHCSGCGYDRLVAFSCKGRGFCPSCGGRRMADTAARLVEHVLPAEVPYRQWVLSVPPPLRYLLAYDAKLLSQLVQAFTRSIGSWQRHQAKNRYGLARVRDAHPGAVSAIQRFGSSLNLNVHLHTLTPDGVFVEKDGAVRFRKLGAPSAMEVEEIAWSTCLRVLSALRKSGRWVDECFHSDDEDALAVDTPLLSSVYGASITGRLALGPRSGQRVLRFGARRQPSGPHVPAVLGFDVHARVRVESSDCKGLERLCRYLVRPPAGNDRFEDAGGGKIAVRLKRAWSDGTTHVVFTPQELVEKLAALIPPPRVHQLRFHGVFAPRHRLRADIVPGYPETTQDSAKDDSANLCRHRIPWARLLQRVFEMDVLACPRCHSRMQRVAFILKPDAIKAILDAVGYGADSPKTAAA